jgi:CRISPR system Cascade subunit CasB
VSPAFRSSRALEEIVRSWWASLQADPGARAQLRRCRDGVEAALSVPGLALARRLPLSAKTPHGFAHVCDLARLLAAVRLDHRDSLMRRLGWVEFPREDAPAPARPALSEARFRRLLRIDEPTPLADELIRLIRLAGEEAHVGRLAADFLNWSDAHGRASVRQHWAFEYYHADEAPSPPPHLQDSEP